MVCAAGVLLDIAQAGGGIGTDSALAVARGPAQPPAYEIYAMTSESGWDEQEYSVPFDAALDALDATRAVMSRHPDQPFPT